MAAVLDHRDDLSALLPGIRHVGIDFSFSSDVQSSSNTRVCLNLCAVIKVWNVSCHAELLKEHFVSL